MTDKQFNDAFTAAGGWFILTQYDKIVDWKGDRSDLVDELYRVGFDSKRSGTNTRVASTLRIINNGRGKEALEKFLNSKRINSAIQKRRTLLWR